MRQRLNDVIDDFITDNLGEFILESINYMLTTNDMTFMQKLAVVEGAIALGAWTNSPQQQEELRAIRSIMIRDYDGD